MISAVGLCLEGIARFDSVCLFHVYEVSCAKREGGVIVQVLHVQCQPEAKALFDSR